MIDYVDFEENFRKLVNKHRDDEDYHLIKNYPDILSVVMKISSDKSALNDGVVKMIMNGAISYFVLVEDVVPEDEGGIKGYIDDFFVCIYGLHKLLEYDRKLGGYLIKKYWTLEEDYEKYIRDKYYGLTKKIGYDLSSKIISASGIDLIETLIDSKQHPKTYSQQKIRSLQRKISYLFFLFLNRPIIGKDQRRNFENQFFGSEEFKEFAKKLDMLSRTDDHFLRAQKNVGEMFDIEARLKKAKARRLLK